MFFTVLALSLLQPAPAPLDLRAPCPAAEVRRATIQQVIAAGETWLGRCVVIKGHGQGRALAADQHSQVRIGLENGAGARPAHQAFDVVGRIDSCDRRSRANRMEMERRNRETGQISIILSSGYCHFAKGPVLIASEVRVVR